jgi:hypothetical protein
MPTDPGGAALSNARSYLEFAERAENEAELRSYTDRAKTSALIAISEQLQHIANTLDRIAPNNAG